jgi:hypothetical protein
VIIKIVFAKELKKIRTESDPDIVKISMRVGLKVKKSAFLRTDWF